ncbi:MAG: HAMP domain-containing protein, partial [Gammaproteobacteria bacterium]|nr:HAMP domain-containing protein [Gammaproteobacteria bacterium]
MLQASPRRKSGVTVGLRLYSINSVLLVALIVVGFVAWSALSSQQVSTATMVTLSHAQRLHQNADMMHEALQSDVYKALLLPELHSDNPAGVVESVKEHGARLRADLAGIEQLGPREQAVIDVAGIRPKVENYITMASTLTELAVTNRDAALKEVPAFDNLFNDLAVSMEATTTDMAAALNAAEQRSLGKSVEAKNWLALTGLLAALVSSGLVVLLGWSIRTGIRQIRDAATQLAAGNLSARSEISSSDDFGEISQALNQMAERLQELFGKLRSDAERDAYGKQLADAMEMSDTEAEVCAVVARAMNVVSPDTPMELLVADSSRAHLEKATAHPLAGAPGCGVESPFSCVAVRRAQTMVFPDSETLNACPRLRDRPSGPTGAVCVPV